MLNAEKGQAQNLDGAQHFLRSEEHTSELQSQSNLVCRLLLEKKKRLNSSHSQISYAVFCLKQKTTLPIPPPSTPLPTVSNVLRLMIRLSVSVSGHPNIVPYSL